MKNAALIVAAGRGSRMAAGLPKQYLAVGRNRVLTQTLAMFVRHPEIHLVQVVIHPDDHALYEECVGNVNPAVVLPPVEGGETRIKSVRLGLEALAGHAPDKVLIHDAARPFCPPEVISSVVAALATYDGAFPALPVVDALWRVTTGQPIHPEDRTGLWRAQTPQGFRFRDICRAHDEFGGTADDDVGIARSAGLTLTMVPGAERNFKITTAADMERAERITGNIMDVRTGNGFDVHAFASGDSLVLNGVKIPFNRTLSGHSDADVGMHAVTDAIFGALAEGDIGQWFPPSDPQWKGAASESFLAKAVERVSARGYRIANLDCTLICEQPKISPYCDAMRKELARICLIDPSKVSVKATTTEHLGFTGREEGIAAMASATLLSH